MRSFKLALIAICILGSQAMAEECPAPEKVVEGLRKAHEEMKKTVAAATGVDVDDVALPLGTPSDKDLWKLSKTEKPDTSSFEFKDCLYHVEGMKRPIVIIGVKKK